MDEQENMATNNNELQNKKQKKLLRIAEKNYGYFWE